VLTVVVIVVLIVVVVALIVRDDRHRDAPFPAGDEAWQRAPDATADEVGVAVPADWQQLRKKRGLMGSTEPGSGGDPD
jgi:hypothetical protein